MKTQKRAFTLVLIALCTVLVSQTAAADELLVEGQVLGMVGQSQDFVNLSAGNGTGGMGFLVGYQMDTMPELRFLASYGVDGMTVNRFNRHMTASWSRHRVMVGADYGILLFADFVRPLARVGVGYAGQRLALSADGVEYADRAHGFAAQGQAGVEVDFTAARTEGPLSVGANFLVGYLWQTSASFDAMAPTAERRDDDPWSRSSYDAGSLSARGVTWNLGVSLRYRL